MCFVGDNTIYLKVKNNYELWSNEVSSTLTINNLLPVASIEFVTPNPADYGTAVSLSGTATDPDGGDIQAFEWSSNVDGLFGSSGAFSNSNFSPGTHVITLRVQDDEGAWSQPDTTVLTINNAVPFAGIDYISPESSLLELQSGSDDSFQDTPTSC